MFFTRTLPQEALNSSAEILPSPLPFGSEVDRSAKGSEVNITDATRELIVSLSVRNYGSPKALVHYDRRDACRSGSEARRVKLRYKSPSLENSVT